MVPDGSSWTTCEQLLSRATAIMRRAAQPTRCQRQDDFHCRVTRAPPRKSRQQAIVCPSAISRSSPSSAIARMRGSVRHRASRRFVSSCHTRTSPRCAIARRFSHALSKGGGRVGSSRSPWKTSSSPSGAPQVREAEIGLEPFGSTSHAIVSAHRFSQCATDLARLGDSPTVLNLHRSRRRSNPRGAARQALAEDRNLPGRPPVVPAKQRSHNTRSKRSPASPSTS